MSTHMREDEYEYEYHDKEDGDGQLLWMCVCEYVRIYNEQARRHQERREWASKCAEDLDSFGK